MVLLQLTPPDLPQWVRLVSQGFSIVAAVIGLGIAYQAYRGYRRNSSRPMLFLAIGFVLTLGLPFLLVVPLLLFPDVEVVAIALTFGTDVLTVIGLAAILYALRMPVGGG
jgi:hypothetical protein